ncbi:MAG TPA: class I SAM-dependent methyltransferase [Burkholderiales bacterium]
MPAPAQSPKPSRLDVPYVPTSQATVEAMLRVANVGAKDYVIDLGSGDGRILITAARRYGARGFGVDLNPERVKESIENARAAGVSDRVRFVQQNLYHTPIAEATVLTMYLLPRVNLELRPRLLAELKPGTRVVSHDFDMGDWQPDLHVSVRGSGSIVLLWIIPARVAGRWRVQGGLPDVESFEIVLTQKYQELEATARGLGRPATVREPRIEGSRIAFMLVDDADFAHRVLFEGTVGSNMMEGTARGDGTAPGGERKWRAHRAAP